MKPSALVLHATGTNRDREAAWAVEAAGALPQIVHVNELARRPAGLHDFQMLILPGGFSYGDDLGAGRLWAIDLRWLFQDELARFIGSGKPVLGICNGFQALVKSGWLPGPPGNGNQATLTRNASNRFECRWVSLAPAPDSRCVFTSGLTEIIRCPVAHGEGRFVPKDQGVLERIQAGGLVALTYVAAGGGLAGYPDNPNGSIAGIAGICNDQGNVLGLMPHPEDHILPEQNPVWSRRRLVPQQTQGREGGLGLPLFVQGVRYAAGL